uniref:COP9 signalosome complex subunit 8 n=1 Tax=Podarcis muralis TaxID=64176 RepID=A0A670HUE7_PODMU
MSFDFREGSHLCALLESRHNQYKPKILRRYGRVWGIFTLAFCQYSAYLAPGGIATPPVYAQLLALYLLHNDMNNARYLWKRIPPAIKSANPELGAIWSVGQRIWQRDFPGIYTTIGAHQWSESIQPIMEALRDATRRRAFGLVSQAYTSISADDFAAFVGLPIEEAVKGVLDQGWQADSSTRMVMPKKPGPQEPSFNRFHPLSGIHRCLSLDFSSLWPRSPLPALVI